MKNINIKELERKIEELEKTLFYINMIDHWTREDSTMYEKYSKELQELKDLLIKEVVA